MIATLEEQLAASIALVNAQKLSALEIVKAEEALASDPATRRMFLMPKPPAQASEVPMRLSPSSANTFLHDCELKWFYRKVLKLPETRSASLGLGTAVHHALTENFRNKLETKRDLDVPGVQAMFIDALIEQLDQVKLQRDESADDLKEAGEVMVRVYMDQAAPSVNPAAIEEHVEGKIGDVDVHGYIDIRTVEGLVIDLKTAAKKPSGMTAAHQLQVGTYVMLSPHASGAGQLATLTKTRTVSLHQQTIDITPPERRLTTRLYSIALEKMSGGVYSPNRASNLCSRKYCSFWSRCEDECGGRVRGEVDE